MSLVENLINQISTNELGGITKPQGFDMNDNTFENLLQRSLNNLESEPLNQIGTLGAPSGLFIEPYDKIEETKEVQPINTEEIQIKEINMDDFFTGIIKSQDTDNQGIFDLAKKHAANAYNSFAGKYVANLREFIGDTMSLT